MLPGAPRFLSLAVVAQALAWTAASAVAQAPAASDPATRSALTARGEQAYRDARYREAEQLFTQALALVPDQPTVQVVLLYELGRTQARLHEGAAQQTLRSSLKLVDAYESSARLRLTSLIELALADALRDSGDMEAARKTYASALQGLEAQGDLSGQGDAHAGIGSTHLEEAHFPEALAEYRKASELYAGSTTTSAATQLGPLQVDIASLMVWLGQYEQADKALADATSRCAGKAPDTCGAYVDHARSLLEFARGRYRVSADAASRAARDFGKAHPIEQARALNNLGIALAKLHDKQAVPVLKTVIDIQRANDGDPRDIAAALDSLGSALREIKQPGQARANYVAALQIWQQLHNREGQRDTLANLGDLGASQDQRASAVLFYKLSVNTAQSLRADAHLLDPTYRASLARRVSPAYRSLAALLVDMGRWAEANQVTRMLKEDERFEFLRGGGGGDTTAALAGPENHEAARYDSLAADQFELAHQLAILDGKLSSELTADDRQRIVYLRQRLDAAGKELAAFVDDLEHALTLEKRLEPPRTSVADLEGVQATLGRLGHGAVLLRYVVLDSETDALRILLVSSDLHGERGYKVPVSATLLNRTVGAFRDAIKDRSPKVVEIAQQLHEWLLPKPLRDDLVGAHAGMLMVSLDGVLRYMPFGALHDGKAWLVQTHPVALYDDAGAIRLEHAPRAAWSVEGFGMTLGAEGLPALANVGAELKAIVGPGLMPGHATLDEAFTSDHLHDVIVHTRPPVLHIASHFVFRLGTPDQSFLLLGQGHLTLKDLNNWNFAGIDLMTLSACETAVSGVDASGRELESFASLAQQHGADAVLATLWPVDDPSTAFFMSRFYAARRLPADSGPPTKAEAMQSAQVAMIRGDIKAQAAAANPRGDVQGGRVAAPADFRQPYYWAPFVLVGNWL